MLHAAGRADTGNPALALALAVEVGIHLRDVRLQLPDYVGVPGGDVLTFADVALQVVEARSHACQRRIFFFRVI